MSISPSEWEVMRVVWAHPNSTANDIIQALSHLHWKDATIKTLIGRLVDKKQLIRHKEAKQAYQYFAVQSEHNCLLSELAQLATRTCPKHIGELTYDFIAEQNLSQQDITRLMQLLAEKITKAPQTIPCHCPKGQCTCHTTKGVAH